MYKTDMVPLSRPLGHHVMVSVIAMNESVCMYGLWTLESSFSRLRGHPEGPESLHQNARRSSRRSSPRYSYNAGSAGLVDGAGYPGRTWGVVFLFLARFGEKASRAPLSFL